LNSRAFGWGGEFAASADSTAQLRVRPATRPIGNSAERPYKEKPRCGGAFAASGKGVDAILMLSSAVIGANQEYLAGLTLGLRLPAVTIFRDFARRGGLMAYGINPVNLFRQSAPIIAKVLRGSKPSEVPAELPTKFELVVNLRPRRD
jgi:ABC transporter substrate binding protein